MERIGTGDVEIMCSGQDKLDREGLLQISWPEEYYDKFFGEWLDHIGCRTKGLS